MLLQKLILENFQGIRGWEVAFPGGCSASIYGDNATGKTTVYNAVTWLLFDRASTGAKGFTPKTRGPEGELHHLDHSATGEFITQQGTVTLKKTYREIWKKKRGSAEQEYSGNTTDYFINGVPVKEKDYQEAVLSYSGGDADQLKLLTMPDYFPEQMKWEDRRKILLDVCGDVSDDQVIASTDELKDLPAFLKIPGQTDKLYSIDEYRKITAAKRRDINQQLDLIPARIDEASRSMPDTAGIDIDTEKAAIAEANQKIDELLQRKAQISAGNNATAEIQAKIAEKKADLARVRGRYQEEANSRNQYVATQIDKASQEYFRLRMSLADAETDVVNAKTRLERLKADRDSLLKQYKDIAGQKWNPGSEICPTCGQKLPGDQIAHMRANFNEKKSKALESISTKGKTQCSKGIIANAEAELESLEKTFSNTRAELESKKSALQDLQAHAITIPAFEMTDEYKSIAQEIKDLMASENDAFSAARSATNGIDEEIASFQSKISEAQENLAKLKAKAQAEKRIGELNTQQRELSEEFDKTEQGLYLSDLFIKTKVRMLTEQINQKFHSVSFQLFVDQVNGGVKEGCEALVPGDGGRMIPYAYANNAARINAGLEIISTLSDHWGIRMPVFIDNAEAITCLGKVNTQVIRLVVSEKDKALRVELSK